MTSLLNMLSPSIRNFAWTFSKRPFPSSKNPRFQNEPNAQSFLWKWVLFAWEWKINFISEAEHLTSFWYRGPGEQGNGLFQRRVVASSPSFSRPAARAPWRACWWASITIIREKHIEEIKPPWNYVTAFTGILLITDFCLQLSWYYVIGYHA